MPEQLTPDEQIDVLRHALDQPKLSPFAHQPNAKPFDVNRFLGLPGDK